MGAGQIGGIATLIDIDFNNAAGFIGTKAQITEAQYVVYFLSHTMMFCAGAMIEAHVVLTPASCVYGEKFKFDVFGGTHQFLEFSGVPRTVQHMCIHRGYNHTIRWQSCSTDNLALLVLTEQFQLNHREPGTEFIMSRIRYGAGKQALSQAPPTNCKFYGWGSRRNGYLVPLLITLRRVDVNIVDSENCLQMFNFGEKYLCIENFPCRSNTHGALCPDDLGSVIECSGFLRGLMTSRLIDRPCGTGFLDMNKYIKFMTCGVDDSRDIINHDDFMEFEFDHVTVSHPASPTPTVVDIPRSDNNTEEELDKNDPGPPKGTTDSREPEEKF